MHHERAPAWASGLDAESAEAVRRFAELYWRHNKRTFFSNRWLGIPTFQHPFDAWVTQEIIVEVRPDVIVEAGSYGGGSAALWATVLEQVNPDGRVIAIDVGDGDGMEIARTVPVFRRRVEFLRGSSVDPRIVEQVAQRVHHKHTLVVHDSAHDAEHVGAELDAYAPMVTEGSYLIVQDTFVNGHPLESDWGPGPWEAVEQFLAGHDRFEADRERERMFFTFNPRGFLRRKRVEEAG